VLWYAELLIETLLFAVLWFREAPRWFSILIGADCATQLLQIVFYRAGLVEFARVFSRSGDVVIAGLCFMAIIEATKVAVRAYTVDPRAMNRASGHVRILAFWISSAKLCGWMEVGQPDAVVFWWNHVLLATQGIAFAAWIWLYLVD